MTVRACRDRPWSLGLLLVACALVLLLAGPAASAQAKDWHIDNIDALLNVQENGDVLVDETVTFAFQGNYHFVAIDVPTANYQGIDSIEVRDATGAVLTEGDTPGTFSLYKSGDTQSIQVNFDLTDTSGTWVFHYRAKKVVQWGEKLDGLVWYVFDANTPVAIGAAKATVKLPGSVPSDQITREAQVGYGAQWTATSPAPLHRGLRSVGLPCVH